MITSDQWRAYNDAVESIRSDAAREVERRVSEYMANEWDGDVASARDAAKRIMASQVAEYDRRAASLAAAWYDAQARESGAKLDRAVTAVPYTERDVDALARYQAGKLDGDIPDADEFARMCGEFAANDAMKSVNRTVLRNVKRDREKGAKFARVTSGRNTCPFCLMLAGRGAVYHSRKTAGQFDHWHRHCTCKIVPSFSGDKYEVLVEGHDPKDAQRWSDRVEDAKKSKKEIPDYPDDAGAEAEALQGALDDAWAAHLKNGSTKTTYRECYAKAVRSVVPENPIEIEDFSKLEGKELQEAMWLAKTGHKIKFRNPNDHKGTDGNTSDVLLDGVTCDFKKISSPKVKKAVGEITAKLDRQGPEFLLDITESRITEDEALVRMAQLLDDPDITKIFVVKNGRIYELKK